jgi:hypothetical protein
MPTALDNGRRSPRKLLRAVNSAVARRQALPQRTRLLIGAVRAIEGSRQSAPRLTVGTAARDRANPPHAVPRSGGTRRPAWVAHRRLV